MERAWCSPYATDSKQLLHVVGPHTACLNGAFRGEQESPKSRALFLHAPDLDAAASAALLQEAYCYASAHVDKSVVLLQQASP